MRKKHLAWIGSAIGAVATVSANIEKIKNIIDAPASVAGTAKRVLAMFRDMTPGGWAVISVMVLCAAIGSSDWWLPWIIRRLRSVGVSIGPLLSLSAPDRLSAVDEKMTYHRVLVTPQVAPTQARAYVSDVRQRNRDGTKTSINDAHEFQLSWAAVPADMPTLLGAMRLGILEKPDDGNLRLCTIKPYAYSKFNGEFEPGTYELDLRLVTVSGGQPTAVEIKTIVFDWDGLGDPVIVIK